MEELMKVLEQYLDENMLQAVVSGAKKADIPSKIKIRPVLNKELLKFQTAITDGKKEIHKNFDNLEMREQLKSWMESDYKQLQMDTVEYAITVLVSKKGKMTIKKKRWDKPKEPVSLQHNRKKKYVLEEGTPIPFLLDLGVMTQEGKIVNSKYDKFRQINRFLEFVEDIMPQLDRTREVTIIDFGCGKSYLTFAMYYYLKILQGLDIHMIGLDLKEDVIEKCNGLAKGYGYDKLEFYIGDIASYEGVDQVDMVVTLHACDTATDYALAKAVKWGAEVILSVPCCQHELNGQIQNDILEPVLKYGLIKERMAALLTDAFRAGRLEEEGYNVQILEFIDMEHTPKNILIRAVKAGVPKKVKNLAECMELVGARPTINKLLNAKEEA
ncbi:class I SAM-dependent methyltransferase [Robinsoniella peoriensis]|uniref:class I SAM-dependent methyltransferase n=1 Tax=Robinsoniella peoriensis TaxID=180332 RepID=UPI0037510BFA